MDERNPYAFISEDVIVWNGVVSKFGSVENLIEKDDDMRLANEQELENYKSKNK